MKNAYYYKQSEEYRVDEELLSSGITHIERCRDFTPTRPAALSAGLQQEMQDLFVDDWSVRDISAATGISYGKTYSIIHNKTKLYNKIAKIEFDSALSAAIMAGEDPLDTVHFAEQKDIDLFYTRLAIKLNKASPESTPKRLTRLSPSQRRSLYKEQQQNASGRTALMRKYNVSQGTYYNVLRSKGA